MPRPQLSVVPVAQGAVVIDMPPGMRKFGRRVSVLALFINEEGAVDRIVVEGPPLPFSMEQSARQAFRAAHFSPGQVNGHAVKSQIRVEVVFGEETPTPINHGQ